MQSLEISHAIWANPHNFGIDDCRSDNSGGALANQRVAFRPICAAERRTYLMACHPDYATTCRTKEEGLPPLGTGLAALATDTAMSTLRINPDHSDQLSFSVLNRMSKPERDLAGHSQVASVVRPCETLIKPRHHPYFYGRRAEVDLQVASPGPGPTILSGHESHFWQKRSVNAVTAW